MFKRITAEDRTYALAHYHIGIYNYSAKNYAAAVEAFEKVRDLHKNLGKRRERILYLTRFYLAVANDKLSTQTGISPAQAENYRNNAKRYCQEFKDQPVSDPKTAEHQALMGTINQICPEEQ